MSDVPTLYERWERGDIFTKATVVRGRTTYCQQPDHWHAIRPGQSFGPAFLNPNGFADAIAYATGTGGDE